MQTAPRPSIISNSNRSIDIDSNGSNLRVYQVWKGSNKFCLGGRLIFGPDVRSIFLTVFLIVTPVILFCSCISQRLISEFHYPLGHLIIATCIVLAVFVIFLLLLTSARDPGIIPRNQHPPEPEDDNSNLSADWAGSQHSQPSLPPIKDVLINGMVVKVKYCQTCMLYRPPRCSHCSICNNCVERFDHHCPWVGQCIGKRNYRYFFMFVSSTTMLCLYVHAICWVNIKEIMNAYHYNLWKAFGKSPVSSVLILYTFITAWFVGGLTVFHLYLILTNQTTYENFRYRYNAKMNPYNKGCVGNIMDIFFSKIPGSRNNFREKVKGKSISVSAPSTSLHQHVTSPKMPKRSFDVEMGKRRAVVDEDIEEIQIQIDSIGAIERGRTQPRYNHKYEWEISPDIRAMASEFRMEHEELGERQKINGVL